MPETANRMSKEGLKFTVRDCHFDDQPDLLWTPTGLAPGGRKKLVYVDRASGEDRCRITYCDVDDRQDLQLSTLAAVKHLEDAWNDDLLRSSGSIVQITIASHNAGYDDRRFGKRGYSNQLPSFERWKEKNPKSDWPTFYGSNLTCNTPEEEGCSNKYWPAETQHYVYTIVAQHILAVCYYGQNYGSDPVAKSWKKFQEGQGFCKAIDVPTPEELR